MQTITVIIAGVLALGVVVFVHELGHFLVAKAAGIRVLKFSLGFGKKLIGFKYKETEYVISALPLGGFVKMAGENPKPGEALVVKPGDFTSRPWWARVLVLLAGPGMNFVTAVLVLGLIYWIGFQVPLAQPQVMEIAAGSPAQVAELQTGDVVLALENEPVENWEKFSDRINALGQAQPGQAGQLTVQRAGETLNLLVYPELDPESGRYRLGITIAPAGTNVIDRVFVGTPAERSGFKAQDQVLAVEGERIYNKYEFQQLVWPRAKQPTRFQVARGDEVIELKVTPMTQQLPGKGTVGVIGVNFVISDKMQTRQYPFFQAFGLGARQTYGIGKMILTALGQMITGKVSAKDSLGGPITIMRMAGQEAKSGAKDFFFFLAAISVMLGIINLLPIPIMDGGNTVFLLIEGLIRKPVSLRVQEVSQQIGFVLLVAIMVFATYNDIYKIVAPALGGSP